MLQAKVDPEVRAKMLSAKVRIMTKEFTILQAWIYRDYFSPTNTNLCLYLLIKLIKTILDLLTLDRYVWKNALNFK